MRQSTKLQHKFVESFPDQLAPATVYVSLRFASVSHLCGCGCGREVVTPLTPADWKLIFDGETVSLFPSVGNWSLPCRSHYWIRSNVIVWADQWSTSRIQEARTQDAKRQQAHFGHPSTDTHPTQSRQSSPETSDPSLGEWLRRLFT